MSKLVSIVLPVYNGAKYLRESIESVVAQTYTNWELLIVDDCSTDETAEISKEYAEKDARIKYFLNDVNLRLPRNLNKGFSLAKGDYLTWTSDDNKYKPEAIQTMVMALENNAGAEFVFCGYEIIDELGNSVVICRIPVNYEDMIVGSNIVGACFLYTRKVYDQIGDYQHGRLLTEDYDYWQRIFAKFEIVAENKILYYYRQHSKSLTGTVDVSITNTAYEETIKSNRALFKRFNLPKRYYYYFALHRCHKSKNSNKYRLAYYFYKFIYYYPYKLIEKFR